jgi:hypothetical protein
MTYAGLQSNPATEFKETGMLDLVTVLIYWGTLSLPVGMLAGMFISNQDREEGE